MPTDAVPDLTDPPHGFRAGMWPAWIALACALALTLVAWRYTREDFERHQRLEFDTEVRQLRADLRARLEENTRVLRAAAALFAATDHVSPKGWHDFVTGLRLSADYPAIQAVTYARIVGPEELPALVADRRRAGLPGFAVWPVARSDRHVVNIYAEPMDGPAGRALGYDMWQDPDRREAMQRAIRTGAPAITGRIRLNADSGEAAPAAFLMYLPVAGKSGSSPRGFVLSPFRVPLLMKELIGDGSRGLAMSIHDGVAPGPENLLYSTDGKNAAGGKFVHAETMAVGGRTWTLSFSSLPSLEARSDGTRSLQVLAGGLLTSMLLFTIAWSVATTRDRALRLAREMTGSLRESEARLRVLVDSAPDAIVVFDVDQGRFIDANAQAEVLFGCSREEILNGDPQRFYPAGLFDGKTAAENVATMIQRALGGDQLVFDRTLLDARGRLVRCEMRLVRLPSTARRLIRGSFIDITERKRAEEDLRVAAITFESQDGVMITDAKARILRVNRAFTEITGFGSEEVVGRKPNMLRSGRHDDAFFAVMRETIRGDGTWRGEIWNRRKSGEIYPGWVNITAVRNRHGVTTHYVTTFADITQRRAAEDEIRHLAFYDALTQLPNRRLMLDRLRQALVSSARSGRHGALMLFDLDDFKTLNDTLGHDVGDQFLVEVGTRMASCIREGDTVARLGGDEFVVILEQLDAGFLAAMQAESVAVKIQAALDQPYLLDLTLAGGELNTRSYHCTSSIGITLFRGNDVAVDELLKRADTAMYEAKAAGRNTLRFFDPQMQAAVSARATLDTDLRAAITESQFVLHYQPQVDGSGRITGAEALVRWQHPRRGLVYPAEFIDQAEASRLIMPLGRWVLDAACRQLAAWAGEPGHEHLDIAVNVSGRQFHQADFVEQVRAVLAATGANPRRLKLEITESLLLHDNEEVVARMTALKEDGISFSLDDFGTGYSSLYYLKRLPLAQLKIDRSFVRDILTDANDAAIACTVIALGESLGLAVIAEGVETAGQRDFLMLHGCHAFQGNLFGEACSPERLFAATAVVNGA